MVTVMAAGSQVRLLDAADWAVLKRLRLASIEDAPQALLCRPEVERARSDEEWALLLNGKNWLAAFAAAGPVGIAACVVDPATGRRYVESMWVDPTHRRRGVAGQLLRAAGRLARSQGHGSIYLWVLEGNTAARDFYLRQGFSPTGVAQPIGDHHEMREEEFSLALTGPDGPAVIR